MRRDLDVSVTGNSRPVLPHWARTGGGVGSSCGNGGRKPLYWNRFVYTSNGVTRYYITRNHVPGIILYNLVFVQLVQADFNTMPGIVLKSRRFKPFFGDRSWNVEHVLDDPPVHPLTNAVAVAAVVSFHQIGGRLIVFEYWGQTSQAKTSKKHPSLTGQRRPTEHMYTYHIITSKKRHEHLGFYARNMS